MDKCAHLSLCFAYLRASAFICGQLRSSHFNNRKTLNSPLHEKVHERRLVRN